MPDRPLRWQIPPAITLPDWLIQAVSPFVAEATTLQLAQVLWQRGIQDVAELIGFLNPEAYQPTSPFAFGLEMEWAIARLQQARSAGEKVAIWGDFDADGVTATAVLWDGLGQFFTQHETLVYEIPNRLTESHGLSSGGIDRLHAENCQLIVTCDTGSTNLAEIDYACSLGIDVIITDHHTLPNDRPPVTAIINPRSLPGDHPLATLSGVAVAYKLVEALYDRLPNVAAKPLSDLLDLVAIGLIADLVQLKGDCRYLAQIGIQQLQKQANSSTATRPGLTKLLELCKRSGDRPTDISFGLGPRINAVSRIQGNANFCVELLTSQDVLLCTHLAEATELANTRRRELQKDLLQQVKARLSQLDLSTTHVIVLADEQWHLGILGLAAGQIAQEYDRPTILLSLDQGLEIPLARGSARSVHNIDLYQLVKDQAHLLHRFGGHPFAAGLSLPVANLPLFAAAINQQLRQMGSEIAVPALSVDLVVTVADLGKELFQALKLLEPCGMGNPVPKLLVQNCWVAKPWNKKIHDAQGRQVQYIKTEFELWDDSVEVGFAGIWWGHYKDELPQGRCDVVVELDSNNFKQRQEVRLLAVRPCEATIQMDDRPPILDWRNQTAIAPANELLLEHCPHNWAELQTWFRQAVQAHRPLAIAYPPPSMTDPLKQWQQLVGIAKYLSRTGSSTTWQVLRDRLQLSDRTLQLGCETLKHLGFSIHVSGDRLEIDWQDGNSMVQPELIQPFLLAVQEEQFRQQYFSQVPIETIRAIVTQAQ
jgi:single-stranded-DNA-specific exonuclease